MIQLHTAATPNGRKASIALEELGLPYEVERRRDRVLPRSIQQPDFLAEEPESQDPGARGRRTSVIWESGAILLHLGEKHDPEGRISERIRDKRIGGDPVRLLPDRRHRSQPRPSGLRQLRRPEGESATWK